jgi:hypothetical protein
VADVVVVVMGVAAVDDHVAGLEHLRDGVDRLVRDRGIVSGVIAFLGPSSQRAAASATNRSPRPR